MTEIDERAVEIALGDRRGAFREQTMREGLSALLDRGWNLAPPGASVMEWQSDVENAPLHQDLYFYREDAGVFFGQRTSLDGILSDEEMEASELSEDEIFEVDFWSTGFSGAVRCDADLKPTYFALPTPPKQGVAADE